MGELDSRRNRARRVCSSLHRLLSCVDHLWQKLRVSCSWTIQLNELDRSVLEADYWWFVGTCCHMLSPGKTCWRDLEDNLAVGEGAMFIHFRLFTLPDGQHLSVVKWAGPGMT